MAKICFVCISLRAGGTERVVSRLANDLCQKHDVSIVVIHNSVPFYELDARVRIFPDESWKPGVSKWLVAIKMLRHIRTVIGQVQPDVILAFGELISPIARIASLGSGARFIAFNRESPLRGLRGRSGIVNPLVYPMADYVVNQTESAGRILQNRYRFSRFKVIPNPIDVPQEATPMSLRSQRIVSVGYLGGEKNQQALLRAFARIPDKDGWKVLLVGDGPDKPALQRLSRALGVEHDVEFLGERKDVPELLQEASIFAFTSLSEGFPNALSEALAHGCACIAFDCISGPSDLIAHGVNGFLVNPGEDPNYALLLKRLIEDADLRGRFSRNARESVRRFEAGAVISMLEVMIEDVMDRNPKQCKRVDRKANP